VLFAQQCVFSCRRAISFSVFLGDLPMYLINVSS